LIVRLCSKCNLINVRLFHMLANLTKSDLSSIALIAAHTAGVPRARRSNVQFDVEESPIIGEGSLKSTSWARKPTSNRSTFDVERSPDLKPSDHAGVVMDADTQYKEEQAS